MSQTTVHEPPRQVPVRKRCEVLVAGGGPAGTAAALAAAVVGAKVALFDTQGRLGGVWTAGLLSYVLDCGNKGGLLVALRSHLEKQAALRVEPHHGAHAWTESSFQYDAEEMTFLLESLCVEAGVEIHFHTRIVSCQRDNAGKITHALTESKSGREAWAADVFIDATGDGDLAAIAGCSFEMGHPVTGHTQPASLMALVSGPEAHEIEDYLLGRKPGNAGRLGDLLRDHGWDGSYSKPALFHIRDRLYALMANHQYLVPCNDASAITAATIRGRREIREAVDSLRRLGGHWGKIATVATAAQIGIREGRRINGVYRVTEADLARGIRHDDSICDVTFPVDIHSLTSDAGRGFGSEMKKSVPYQIPWRALLLRDVENLVLAGRCVSGDFFAHGSYRVTGNAVATGEAAGVGAALSSQMGTSPKELQAPLLLRELVSVRNRLSALTVA